MTESTTEEPFTGLDAIMANQAAERSEYLEPIMTLIDSEAFETVSQTLSELRSTYSSDERIAPHLNAIASILPRLREAL